MMESLANDYEVIMLKQTYSNLSAPTKAFRDDVYKRNIMYQKIDYLIGVYLTQF